MTPADILSECQRSGVTLGADAHGGLAFRGDREAINRLLPTIKAHKAALLAALAGKSSPPAPLIDIQELARDIAKRHGTTAEFCLAMLDEGDIHAIAAGSDSGRADAWRGFVGLAVQRGEAPRPAPASADKTTGIPGSYRHSQHPTQLRCSACRHAQPTGHAVLVECGKGQQAPGCCGYWHSTDRHQCAEFDAATGQ